ncbi:MAG: VWA domain-containing protein [Deinococcales bacterium]
MMLKRLDVRKWIEHSEKLSIEPNMELVSKIISLSKLLPTESRESARQLVRGVVERLKEKLSYPLLQTMQGSLNKALKSRHPKRLKDIHWLQTIHTNLKHYQVEKRSIIPEKLIGYGKERSSLYDVMLCIDQSGSMSQSVVYASVFGSIMASLPAISLKLILFDTAVVDMTEQLADPVDLLFGIRLKGGTNIDRALSYCQQQITRPRDTVLVLISDLFEGGDRRNMLRRCAELSASGVKIIVLLALSDEGSPRYNKQLAQELADMNIVAFACNPELFPEVMGAALNGWDVKEYLQAQGLVNF